MAAVYAATHRNGNRVAIKILHPDVSSCAGIKERFIEEGYIANRIKHEGTASVFDDGETADGVAFLVMELLEGQTLEERLQTQRTIPAREVLAIVGALLDVLAAAHDEGIVHRDIKPDNIFITHSGTVRLLDFGIARWNGAERLRTTQAGVTMGTPAFMPPEQARGHWEQVDGRTDVWAVGATMFTALTGRLVHRAETANEELLSAMTKPAPSLGDIAPDAPQVLVNLVDRALAFAPNKRWPDVRAMQVALRAAQVVIGPLPVRLAHTNDAPRAARVVGGAGWSPKASLIPQAMWIAKTRSWLILPKAGISDLSHPRRGLDKR
jgi:eukaryotic-like serine/threonine-protein kinase